MPFIEHPRGRAYYRHWAAAEPRAAVIFLHGFGEHTGLYHRYGFALNAAGIDLWAVDQFGHGLSPGDRGDFGSIEDSSGLADTLTELAEGESPGLPLIAQGHSFGSVVTLFRLLDQPRRYRAGVISGAPLVPIPEMLDTDSSFDLDPGWLSADPFYLDSLENDPLAFVDADGLPLARELDKAWDRFGSELPKLAVPGLSDLPGLGPLIFGQDLLVYLSLAMTVAVAYFLSRSRSGLILRACGESDISAHAIGYRVIRIRYVAVLFGGAMSGLGGAYLSLAATPMWIENMTAGRGWIALALIAFGSWRAWRICAGAYLFGGVTILQLYVQGSGLLHVPSQIMSMLPYLATIALLAVIASGSWRSRFDAPACLGKPFSPPA